MSGAALLSATAVSVFYGGVEAVHGVSLRVDAGQIVSVIGANGAAKTTLLSALMGLLPAHGDVTYLGQRGVTTFVVLTEHGLVSADRRAPFDASSAAISPAELPAPTTSTRRPRKPSGR